ncbi:MAG: hypothetical protein H6735_07175 [Alphaproteobacteria bacterium]|nr:hypothetical protein [Alphaproteobacteria bacterium]
MWLGWACAAVPPTPAQRIRPRSVPEVATPSTPVASPWATALCDHLSRELDCPCTPVAAGEPTEFDGFEVEALETTAWRGKSTLPDIPNLDERNEMSRTNNHGLALELKLTNKAPVAADVGFVIYLEDGTGAARFTLPHNSGGYAESKRHLINLREAGELAPNAEVTAGLVYAVPKGAVRHSLLVLRKNVERPDPADPRGKPKVVATELAVLDLGPPT